MFAVLIITASLVSRRSLLPCCPREFWELSGRDPVTSQPTEEYRVDRAEYAQGLGWMTAKILAPVVFVFALLSPFLPSFLVCFFARSALKKPRVVPKFPQGQGNQVKYASARENRHMHVASPRGREASK